MIQSVQAMRMEAGTASSLVDAFDYLSMSSLRLPGTVSKFQIALTCRTTLIENWR